jgi:hypothetical protein
MGQKIYFYSPVKEIIEEKIIEEIFKALQRYFKYFSLNEKMEQSPLNLEKMEQLDIFQINDKSSPIIILYAPDIETLQEDSIATRLTNLGVPIIPLTIFSSESSHSRFRVWKPYSILELKRLVENLKLHLKKPESSHKTYLWEVPSIKIPDWWTWDVLIVDDEIKISAQERKIDASDFYQLFIKLLFNGQILPLPTSQSINVYVANFNDIENEKKIYQIEQNLQIKREGEIIHFNLETISNMDIIFVDLLEGGRFRGLKWIKEFEHIKKISGFPFVIALSHLSRYQGQFISASEDADYFLSKEDIISARGPAILDIMWFHLKKKNELLLETIEGNDIEKGNHIEVEGLEPKNNQKENKMENLLKLLYYSRYPNVKKIYVINPSSKGKSGADVYFVNVIIGEQEYITPKRVVKIDRLDNISFERYNFNKYISPYIESFTAVPSHNVAKSVIEENILAAHEYTAIGSWKDYFGKGIVDFAEFLLKFPDREKAKEKTYELFSHVLSPLHRSRIDIEKIGKEYGDYYKIRLSSLLNFFEVFLRFKNREIKENGSEGRIFQVYSVEIEEKGESESSNNKMKVKLLLKEEKKKIKLFIWRTTPFLFLRKGKIIKIKSENINENYVLEPSEDNDPVLAALGLSPALLLIPYCKDNCPKLFSYLSGNLTLDTQLNDLKKSPKLSLIHGDLHPRNILYSKSTDYLWLIDFPNSGPGPLAFDFVEFEVALRWFVLSKMVEKLYNSNKSLQNFWKNLEELEECIADFTNPENLSFINNFLEREKESIISTVLAIQTAEEYAFTHYFTTEFERKEYWTTCVLYALSLLGRASKEKNLILELMMAHLVEFIQKHHNIKIVK